MNREEEIREAAKQYNFIYSNNDEVPDCDFIEGAIWADSHPQNPWHSVADGDWPKWLKGDAEDMPFVVMSKGGYQSFAYYDEDEDGVCDFYDDCDCSLDVDYWMEIPILQDKVK